jgi:hypothetical protein
LSSFTLWGVQGHFDSLGVYSFVPLRAISLGTDVTVVTEKRKEMKNKRQFFLVHERLPMGTLGK